MYKQGQQSTQIVHVQKTKQNTKKETLKLTEVQVLKKKVSTNYYTNLCMTTFLPTLHNTVNKTTHKSDSPVSNPPLFSQGHHILPTILLKLSLWKLLSHINWYKWNDKYLTRKIIKSLYRTKCFYQVMFHLSLAYIKKKPICWNIIISCFISLYITSRTGIVYWEHVSFA